MLLPDGAGQMERATEGGKVVAESGSDEGACLNQRCCESVEVCNWHYARCVGQFYPNVDNATPVDVVRVLAIGFP